MRKFTAIAVALGFLASTSLPTLAAPAISGTKTETFSAQVDQKTDQTDQKTTTKKTKKPKTHKVKKPKTHKKPKVKKPKTKKPATDTTAPKTDTQPK